MYNAEVSWLDFVVNAVLWRTYCMKLKFMIILNIFAINMKKKSIYFWGIYIIRLRFGNAKILYNRKFSLSKESIHSILCGAFSFNSALMANFPLIRVIQTLDYFCQFANQWIINRCIFACIRFQWIYYIEYFCIKLNVMHSIITKITE